MTFASGSPQDKVLIIVRKNISVMTGYRLPAILTELQWFSCISWHVMQRGTAASNLSFGSSEGEI